MPETRTSTIALCAVGLHYIVIVMLRARRFWLCYYMCIFIYCEISCPIAVQCTYFVCTFTNINVTLCLYIFCVCFLVPRDGFRPLHRGSSFIVAREARRNFFGTPWHSLDPNGPQGVPQDSRGFKLSSFVQLKLHNEKD